MTGLIGIFLAVAAGLIVSTRRQLLLVIGVPFLVVLVIQTWGIAAGRGVSPPSTVTGFPGAISYYVVQVIIFGLAFGAADQIMMRKVRRSGASAVADQGRQTRLALMVNGLLCAAAVFAFILDHPLFDPGSVKHHKASGSPPVWGVLGIVLCLIVFVGLGLMTLISRRRSPVVMSAGHVASEPVGQSR